MTARPNAGVCKARRYPHECAVAAPACVASLFWASRDQVSCWRIFFEQLNEPWRWRERVVIAAAVEQCDWITPGKFLAMYVTCTGGRPRKWWGCAP